jgi:predicted nuclease with TOPRIM domain
VAETSTVTWLLVAILTGGVGVAVLQRIFANRDAAKQKAVADQQTIDAASVEFFKGLREELADCRTENRRLNDKMDTQAAEFYTLKGKYEAGKDQLELMTGQYFDLLQKYTAKLLEVEVLRAALKEHGIDPPAAVETIAAKHTASAAAATESEGP